MGDVSDVSNLAHIFGVRLALHLFLTCHTFDTNTATCRRLLGLAFLNFRFFLRHFDT